MTDQTGGGVVLIEGLPEGRTTAVCWVVVWPRWWRRGASSRSDRRAAQV